MKIVTTKSALKSAIKNCENEILITDPDLAKNVHRFKSIKKLSKRLLCILIAGSGAGAIGLALAPATGGSTAVVTGVSTGVLLKVTTASGATISTGAIIAIGSLAIIGAAVLYALWKDYDVEIQSSNPWKIKLCRRS